jgi:mRNA interferase MazF
VRRGDLFLVRKPGSSDPKKQRVFAVVSRQLLIQSKFSSVICAPVYSRHDALSTQVAVGTEEGLKRECSVHCDELVSLPKTLLTKFVGELGPEKMDAVDRALAVALDLEKLLRL